MNKEAAIAWRSEHDMRFYEKLKKVRCSLCGRAPAISDFHLIRVRHPFAMSDGIFYKCDGLEWYERRHIGKEQFNLSHPDLAKLKEEDWICTECMLKVEYAPEQECIHG